MITKMILKRSNSSLAGAVCDAIAPRKLQTLTADGHVFQEASQLGGLRRVVLAIFDEVVHRHHVRFLVAELKAVADVHVELGLQGCQTLLFGQFVESSLVLTR